MGLKSGIQSAVGSAIKSLGDLPTLVTHNSMGAVSYNPTTGANTPTITAQTNLKAVFSKYGAREVDGDIVAQGDIKLLIAGADVTIAPKQDDTFLEGTNTWKALNVKKDTADALWTVQVRR